MVDGNPTPTVSRRLSVEGLMCDLVELFIALGGTGFAAAQLDGGQINAEP